RSQAAQVAERARKAIEAQTIRVGGATMNVTVSMGMEAQRKGETLSAAIERADAALYQAKREGRNRVVQAPARPETPDE
ncbi:MAG: diguanylate cyclase, partial [Nannocystaceae bacterium]|nr:diguanylate cyclase [Nannocystaceae bacterium]